MSATVEVARRDLPDGRWVEFTEAPRRGYKLCGDDAKPVKLVSVTTALGVLNRPALIRWSEARGAAGALAAVRLGELHPDTHHDDQAIDVVRILGLGADAAKQQAADRGLDVHDALETYCRTSELPSPQDMKIEARPYMRGLARMLAALDPDPIHVERIICHPGLSYAGRMDLLAAIDGRRTLLDLKTSKSGRGFPEAHAQSVGYAAAEESLGEPWPDRIIVVGVSPNGGFCVDECAAPPDAFERILGVYRLLAEIRKPLEAAARAAKKAQEAA